MEIEFSSLIYAQNNNIEVGPVYLQNVDYKFNGGTAYAIVGNASEVVGKLIVLDKRPTKGTILVNGSVIKRTARIDNIDELKRDLVFIDFGVKYKFAKNYFLEELELLMKNKKQVVRNDLEKVAIDSLLMVGLNERFLGKNLWNLSSSESKKVLLAIYLCLNPKVLVLKNLDQGLVAKDKQNIKRLLNKLKTRYNKLLILLTSNVEFMFELVDKVLVINNGNIVLEDNKEIFYKNELYEYLEKPSIVDFIQYANSKNHEILPYTDIKELLKGIFRDVENKK